MHIKTLIAHIESAAPLHLAAAWDKSGVQVASDAGEVETLCVALDPSPALMACAVRLGKARLIDNILLRS